jgi:hypothetical protein
VLLDALVEKNADLKVDNKELGLRCAISFSCYCFIGDLNLETGRVNCHLANRAEFPTSLKRLYLVFSGQSVFVVSCLAMAARA